MNQKPKSNIDGRAESSKRGTFGDVFTPSVLTILGIILFLRLGFVVGSAGLMKALVIIAIANAISVLTSISLSAVATNLKVKGGGDYYLISRTLGVEFGGALGLVLFLAQSVSIAFNSIGFGEAASAIVAVPAVSSQGVAVAAMVGGGCGHAVPVRGHGLPRRGTGLLLRGVRTRGRRRAGQR